MQRLAESWRAYCSDALNTKHSGARANHWGHLTHVSYVVERHLIHCKIHRLRRQTNQLSVGMSNTTTQSNYHTSGVSADSIGSVECAKGRRWCVCVCCVCVLVCWCVGVSVCRLCRLCRWSVAGWALWCEREVDRQATLRLRLAGGLRSHNLSGNELL
jgi:hypothetical protein